MPKKEIEAPQVDPVSKELLDKMEEFNREIEVHRKAIEDIRRRAGAMLKEAGFPWEFSRCRSIRCKHSKHQRVACWADCIRAERGCAEMGFRLKSSDCYEFDPSITLPKQLPTLGWKKVVFQGNFTEGLTVDKVIREDERYLYCEHCQVDKKYMRARGSLNSYTSAPSEKVKEYIEEKENKGE